MIPSAAPLPGLGRLLGRRWLLLGIGNDLRGDDAFGPRLARRLAAAGLPALDGGIAPERLTGAILARAPEVLILADALDAGRPVGELGLYDPEEIGGGGVSTHDPGLPLLVEYLRGRQDLDVRLLAVQPGATGFGAPLSGGVRRAVEAALALFLTAERESSRSPSSGGEPHG